MSFNQALLEMCGGKPAMGSEQMKDIVEIKDNFGEAFAFDIMRVLDERRIYGKKIHKEISKYKSTEDFVFSVFSVY